jgi:hypothetical protein
MEIEQFVTVLHPSGRGKAQCPPDPAYPDGMHLDMSMGKKSCLVNLPYPAPECGCWTVHCGECGLTVAATAAGRPDDPRTLKVACL